MSNWITQEEIEKARSVDLLTYLREEDPFELVKINDHTYCTREHDSLRISPKSWMWFSRGFGGYTALDYLIKVKGYTFKEAVNTINKKGILVKKSSSFIIKEEPEKKLLLPKAYENNDKVIEYLLGRGIDKDIIDYCIKEKILYETQINHNAIFLGLDEEKIPRYAAYRSTGKERSLGEAKGSDKKFSFRIDSKNSKELHVFESAIDLLSFATICKINGFDWKNYSLISLAGVYQIKSDGSSKIPIALKSYLEKNKEIEKIYLHFDNDKVGIKASEGLRNILKEKYKVVEAHPQRGKDMNDYLILFLKRREEMYGKR